MRPQRRGGNAPAAFSLALIRGSAWCGSEGRDRRSVRPACREIRRIVYATNTIEPVSAWTRKTARARGHFPNEQAVLKRVYLAVMAVDSISCGGVAGSKHSTRSKSDSFDGRLCSQRAG